MVNPDEIYWKWIAAGYYDHEWNTYDEFLKPDHTFIDLGAWIGAHSLYASGTTDKIVAVEPDPVAHDILKGNLACLKNYSIIKTAVGVEGEVILGSGMLGASTTRRNLAGGGNIGPATETFSTPSITLRQLAATLPDPLFIKMDIEGMEEDVFKDLAFFKERRPTCWIEFHPFWWADKDETLRDFQKIADGYKVVKNDMGPYYLLAN